MQFSVEIEKLQQTDILFASLKFKKFDSLLIKNKKKTETFTVKKVNFDVYTDMMTVLMTSLPII